MVIVRIWDGLGNQMFQYAYAYALRERGFDVRIDIDKYLDNSFEKYSGHDHRDNQIQHFNITIPTISMTEYGRYSFLKRETIADKMVFSLSKYGLWKYRYYEETKQSYSEKSALLKGTYYVKGWFQDERYFTDFEEGIRREFSLKTEPELPMLIRNLYDSGKNLVSIHVRRGILNHLTKSRFRKYCLPSPVSARYSITSLFLSKNSSIIANNVRRSLGSRGEASWLLFVILNS